MLSYTITKGPHFGIYINQVFKLIPYYAAAKEVNVFVGARFKKFNTTSDAINFIEKNSGTDQSFAQKSFERTGYPPNVATLSSTGLLYGVTSFRDYSNACGSIGRYSTLTVTIAPPKTKTYYAVANGSRPGIYNTWEECQEAIQDHQFPIYCKFENYEDAKKFCDENCSLSSTNERPFSEGESDSKRLASQPDVFSNAPIVYTDGACLNNGKTTAAAGYGVYWGDNHSDNISAPVFGEPTNSRAEFEGVLAAKKQALKKGIHALIICTDSINVIDSMDKYLPKWKLNGWKTAHGEDVRNRDLIEKIDRIRKDVSVQFRHVKGHAKIRGNEMADALAREGAKKYGLKK